MLTSNQHTKHVAVAQVAHNNNNITEECYSVCEKDYLTMKDIGNEVVMANGKPKPTKYGQLHSMYDSRLCTSQPTHIHTCCIYIQSYTHMHIYIHACVRTHTINIT